MASPSPEAIQSIRARVTDWTPDNAAIAAALNAPVAPNPVPRGTVAVPIAVSGVLGALSPASRARLVNVGFLSHVRDDINAQNRESVALWAEVLLDGGFLTADEDQAILGLIGATQPDPAWPAQISWAVATLGRPVDAADIHAARPENP
jgi:hypothetical protein